MSDGLCTGFTGVAWASEHLAGRLFAADPTAGRDVDEALLASVSQAPWRGPYDLINGLVGIGLYAIERLPDERAANCLVQIVDRLAELAVPAAEGVAWLSPPDLLPAYLREAYPRGLYDLGLSHGAAGVVALLGAACHAGVARATAERLLAGAVPWLLARRLSAGGTARFASYYHPDVAQPPARLAWCYGDLGIAAALHVASRGAGREDWEREAVALAVAAAQRPQATSGVLDAGLCHGAAGAGHLFHRLYQESGDELLRAAADRWLRHALELRRPGTGVAGYRAWSSDLSGTLAWRDDPGLLEGAAGVALALLAAVSSVAPEWDRMLAISLRPSLSPPARAPVP